MIILDTTNRSLEVVLGGAVTTNQLPFVASYADISQSTFALSAASTNTGTSNSTTAVTLIAAPGSSTSRQVKYLTVWNEDTVDADVTIQVNDNSTIRELVTFTLSSGDTLEYLDGRGFAVLDSTGSIKRVNANSQPLNANLTDIAGLTPSDGNVVIGDGSDFITESGATLRTSIGVPTGTSGAVLGFLNGNNTHSGNNTFSGTVTVTGNVVDVEGTSPSVQLRETDGTASHAQTRLDHSADAFRILTYTNTNNVVSIDYRAILGASGATSHQWSINNSEAARINSNSNLLIGTTTPATGNWALDIVEAAGQGIVLSNSETDNTNKNTQATSIRHYDNSEEPAAIIGGGSSSTQNRVRIGGGLGIVNAATIIEFYAAANTTTTTGTEQVRFAHNAAYFPGVGTTGSAANAFLDSGSSPANQLLRSTSSVRYKENIEPVDDWRASDFLTKATPIWYHSLAKADKLQDGSKKSFYSFSAEELAEIDPRLVTWGYDVDDWEEVEIKELTQVQSTHTETRQKDVIEIVDGKAVKKTITEEVEVKEWLEYPLFDDKGNPIMEVVKEAEYDKEGDLLKEAVTQQAIHREPRMVDAVEIRKERQLKEVATLKPDGVNDRAVIAFLTCEIQRLNEVIKG